MTNFKITLYTDPVCAWCFIGHRTLDQAITLYQRTYPGGRHDKFDFIYHPFYLRNTKPEEGSVTLGEAMLAKNGTEAKVSAIKTKMQRIGTAHGILFNYDSKVGSTKLAHVLIQQAGRHRGPDIQKEMVGAMYSMHFEQGGDINNLDELVAVAVKVGVSEQDARAWLRDEHVGAEVDELARTAREEQGVTSVPTIEIGGLRLEGAEDVGGIMEALVSVKEKESAAGSE
ncbi:hypothetical protein LTR56_011958 [Elasticomyces elasticus]|nr:hypothetical protein LTR56_011958 [Elasticomyces elasticus]KAK3654774.1 hypothetical protein LTR22_010540 [Elasticomyces elasticus]KAK4920586.1 hypothetical protein LTR49_011833 [Elasticomyces elasticus]KAK5759386.1 hypothetical protein LTS12_010551 [Elasticomyces elasticus]